MANSNPVTGEMERHGSFHSKSEQDGGEVTNKDVPERGGDEGASDNSHLTGRSAEHFNTLFLEGSRDFDAFITRLNGRESEVDGRTHVCGLGVSLWFNTVSSATQRETTR